MKIGLHDAEREYLRHKNSAVIFQTAQKTSSFDALPIFRLIQSLQKERL